MNFIHDIQLESSFTKHKKSYCFGNHHVYIALQDHIVLICNNLLHHNYILGRVTPVSRSSSSTFLYIPVSILIEATPHQHLAKALVCLPNKISCIHVVLLP